jgi:hypothetical protein
VLLVDADSVWISEEASGTVSATGAETGAGAAGAAGLDSAGEIVFNSHLLSKLLLI